MALKLRSLVAG